MAYFIHPSEGRASGSTPPKQQYLPQGRRSPMKPASIVLNRGNGRQQRFFINASFPLNG
jgi:hypothetical protein